MSHTFDTDYALRCAVRPEQLILVRPRRQREALAIARDFIFGGGISLLAFDLPFHFLADVRLTQALSILRGQLLAPLSQSHCALLFLTSLPAGGMVSLEDYPATVVLPYYAAVRLLLRRERWLHKWGDIQGCEAEVQVVKSKVSHDGRQAAIAVTFDDGLLGGEER